MDGRSSNDQPGGQWEPSQPSDHRADEAERSRDACPICGQHRLALLEFPDVGATGYQAYSDVIGMGDAKASTQPAIGCLGCGAEWRDVRDLREAIEDARRGESPRS